MKKYENVLVIAKCDCIAAIFICALLDFIGIYLEAERNGVT